MKVDKILPCVCCDHEPNAGDSVYYGMPRLKFAGAAGRSGTRLSVPFAKEAVSGYKRNQRILL